MSPILTAEQLRVGYAGRALLPALDLTVHAGETWALCGRNGGGKSTLLRSLLGLQPLVGGALRWADGVRPAYVDQRSQIDRTTPARVLDLVRSGADQGWSFLAPLLGRERRATVARAMDDCDVSRLAAAPVGHLSEGQRQRALVARALASDPNVLVLDEPTSAMDPDNERAIFTLLEQLRAARGLTVLIASHQMTLVTRLATHGVLVDKDHGLLRSGAVAELVATAEWRARYGAPAEEAR